jgi:methyl-accepting chemotaxis protein
MLWLKRSGTCPAEAAKNTTELIETSVGKVDEGVKNSEDTASALTEISANAAKVNDLVSEIAAASVEQTNGIEEVNKGLHQINSVIQQNASIAEEAASASEELSSITMQLQEMMKKFTINTGDKFSTPQSRIEHDEHPPQLESNPPPGTRKQIIL